MSKQFHYPCPDCGQPIKLTAAQAGQNIICQHCQQPLDAPKLGILRQYQIDESPESSSNRISASTTNRVLFSVGLALAVLMGAAGYALYDYASSLIFDFDMDSYVEAMNQKIDALPPADLLTLKKNLDFENGLGDWKEQDINHFRAQGERLQLVSYGLMALSLTGVLLVVTSLIIGKRPNTT